MTNINRVRQPRARQPIPFRRGGASTQVFIENESDSLRGSHDQRLTIHRFVAYLAASIFACASIILPYNARKPSERTRVPLMIGMKLVSPVQRGTTWMCK